MEQKTVYFEKPGKENTDSTLELARERGEALDIKTFVVASSTLDTALKAVDVFKGCKVVVVTHCAGYLEKNPKEFEEESRKIVEKKGGVIVMAAHAFGAIHRSLNTNAPGTPIPVSNNIGDIIAMAYRTFGQGIKVACEIAAMSADAGQVGIDEEIISIGGTGRGVDTAIVLQPSYSHRFFNTKVKEIICKPRL
jgi:uncharacterized protein